MKSLRTLRIISSIICILLGGIIFAAYYFFDINVVFALIVYIVLVLLLTICLYLVGVRKKEDYEEIEKTLNTTTKLAISEGKIGLVTYDKEYVISFMSDLFTKKEIDHTGEKILTWLPELQDAIDGSSDKIVVIINEDKYEVTKITNSNALLFRDISIEYDLEKKLKDESYVLGLCNFDNYDEDNENEDTISYVNANIKLPVIEYFKDFGIVYRTLRNNRLQLILNYSKYEKLLNDRFSILNTVRREAKKAQLDITLSMAFAYGYDDLLEIDNETSDLLEIAQTRGGDQVVVKEFSKEAVFYGGSSEAREKQSTVKVRVMVNTLKHLVASSSNVIIVGHSDADSDCIGSMLGMASIINRLNKENFVVTLSGSIEPMTKDVLNKYNGELSKEFNLVTENEALNHLNNDSLVIMCDHHSLDQSNCQLLLKQAKQVVIIDHHRRKADLDVEAIMLYVEASSSSTCELVTEFFEYINRLDISNTVANIMYLGIVIDTNHFRVRTGSRTFDAAKNLRRIGADPLLVEELAQEPYINVRKRTEIISSANKYTDDILIACMDKGEYLRSIASQASDALIQTKDIEAVFVLCYTNRDEAIITARSKGNINVQVILEKMNGGGHMTAAGLQRKNVSVEVLKSELTDVLDEYINNKEQEKYESNIA